MKKRTKEKLDGFACVVGAMIAPVMAWAQAGAKLDLGSLVFVTGCSIGAGLLAMRLWLAKDPRAAAQPLALPPADGSQR